MDRIEQERAQAIAEAEQRRICRAIIAGLMMHAYSVDPRSSGPLHESIECAVKAADALLAELERTEGE